MTDPHLKEIRQVIPSAEGCEDCMRIGSPWVHLRLCLTCGHVGCCDSESARKKTFPYQSAPYYPVLRAGGGLALLLR